MVAVVVVVAALSAGVSVLQHYLLCQPDLQCETGSGICR